MRRNREKARTGTESIELPELLTIREVCQLLHVHGNTVRRWSDHGIIKAYRIGPSNHRRFKAEDIAALVAGERTVPSEKD